MFRKKNPTFHVTFLIEIKNLIGNVTFGLFPFTTLKLKVFKMNFKETAVQNTRHVISDFQSVCYLLIFFIYEKRKKNNYK